ncbi:hypothetical protein AB0B45_44410 [Nonomuraea sp. NPDC049152]
MIDGTLKWRAARAGMTPRAYAAHTVTTTARHALILLPATDRERLAPS